MAPPPASQEVEDLGAGEPLEGAANGGDVLGSDEGGPADEPQAASKDNFDQRWSANKAGLFKTANRFIDRMTKDAKQSRGDMPYGKVALPEMLLIITSPAGRMKIMKTDMYDNGELSLAIVVRLGVYVPTESTQTSVVQSHAAGSQRLLNQLHEHSSHLPKALISSYPPDGERFRTPGVGDDVSDFKRIAKQLKDLLDKLRKNFASNIAAEKHIADPSEHMVVAAFRPATAH